MFLQVMVRTTFYDHFKSFHTSSSFYSSDVKFKAKVRCLLLYFGYGLI